jgi:hypothetical protein
MDYTIDELIKLMQDNHDNEGYVNSMGEELFLAIDDYIAEHGKIKALLYNGDIVEIHKLFLLFDDFWVRYDRGIEGLPPLALCLKDIKKVLK